MEIFNNMPLWWTSYDCMYSVDITCHKYLYIRHTRVSKYSYPEMVQSLSLEVNCNQCANRIHTELWHWLSISQKWNRDHPNHHDFHSTFFGVVTEEEYSELPVWCSMYIWNHMREGISKPIHIYPVHMACVLLVVCCCQARAWRCGLLISGDYFL